MKKFLQLYIIFLFASLYGQNISDYQYIYIPKEFADMKANKYGLNHLLAQNLKAKKFVITDNSIEFNCETLKAEVSDEGNFFTNKIQINFKDCHDQTVASFEGKSNIKDLDIGMQDALKVAASKIPSSSPFQQEVKILKEKTQENTPKSTENKAETFSNGTLNLSRIFISDSQFILAIPNNSTPYAIFKASTKKDVYRVQLQDGSQTLGYMEDGKIIIELPNADGSFRKEIFEGK